MGIRRCSIRAFGFMIHRDERPNLSLNPDAAPAALRAVHSAPVSLVR
jgi:hypothetical protein